MSVSSQQVLLIYTDLVVLRRPKHALSKYLHTHLPQVQCVQPQLPFCPDMAIQSLEEQVMFSKARLSSPFMGASLGGFMQPIYWFEGRPLNNPVEAHKVLKHFVGDTRTLIQKKNLASRLMMLKN